MPYLPPLQLHEVLSSLPRHLQVIGSPDYPLQICYTHVQRLPDGRAVLHSQQLGVSADRYFYPASTVKLPAILLALEKLERLGIPGLDLDTSFYLEAGAGQPAYEHDPTAPGGRPTLGHCMRKILLASDNEGFNCLFDFLGQDELQQGLQEHGLTGARILHRLQVADTPEGGRETRPMVFYHPQPDGSRLPCYRQSGRKAQYDHYRDLQPVLLGRAHWDEQDKLVDAPMDFTYKNRFPLAQQHRLLQALFFPEHVEAHERYPIGRPHHSFLIDYMSRYPRQGGIPAYQQDGQGHDSRVKFLIFGDSRANIPDHLRIYNKIGNAFGFLLDNAYVVDRLHGVEFLLSAVVGCNPDGRYGREQEYAYEQLGMPFLGALGRAVYQRELQARKGFV